MQVLVTGGGGFIGSHLVERLLRDGHKVRVLDSFATGRRDNIVSFKDVDLVEGDIQSYERAQAAVKGCEAVLHQAALPSVPRSIQDPLTTSMVNMTGTLNILLAARDAGVRRFVFASSSSVYGPGEELPKVESITPAPISPYAASKLAGESYCRAFSSTYGLECIALRYFNIFGPRQNPRSQYAAVLPSFLSALLDGRRPVIYGDGQQSRDFTYVENAVDANILSMESSSGVGEVFNIACGHRTTLNGALKALNDLTGTKISADHVAPRKGDVRHSLADITRAKQTLGYEPRVSFTDGLRMMYEHTVEHRME